MVKSKNNRSSWINFILAGAIGIVTVLVATFAGGTASGTTLGSPEPTPTGTPTSTTTTTTTSTSTPESTTSQPADTTTTAAPAPDTQPDDGVSGAGASQGDPGQESESLAYTGQDNTGFLLLGLALLLGGAALVFTVRRSQHPEAPQS